MAISRGKKAITDGSDADAAPIWILRHHAPSSIHSVRLIKDASSYEILVEAGDSEGRISLTSLKDYRPRCFWKAHKESILGLDMFRLATDNVIVSSGRDNLLQAFSLTASQVFTSEVLPSRIQSELPIPDSKLSLDVNALNYCPFSALQQIGIDAEEGILLAVPHTIDSGYIDLYHLPSKRRIMTAIGKADLATSGVSASRAAIVMSLQLIKDHTQGNHRVIAGYEDGFIKSWKISSDTSSLQWSQRSHSESVMSIAVSRSRAFCVSVAADRLLVKYDLNKGTVLETIKSNSSGHAAVVIREDDELIASGGWDGCVRLYNADLEHVCSLRYHKDTVQALSFVQKRTFVDLVASSDDSDDSEGEESTNGITKGTNLDTLLASGGKEGRICLWKT